MAAERLVGTGEAAKALGLSRRTLSRYAAEGRIIPAAKSPPGRRVHYWWDLDELRRQLHALGERPSDDE